MTPLTWVGKHALVINFGLEGHITSMTCSDFNEITSNSIPGPNTANRELIQSFVIPEQLITPGSSPLHPQTVNILAAFGAEEWTWWVVDFACLVRMHVISHDRAWEESDLHINSLVCNHNNIIHIYI